MSHIDIRFVEDGEWGDEPSKPNFKVKAGEKRSVSARLAKIATDAGKAIFLGKGQISLNSEEDWSEREADLVIREIALDDEKADLEQREKALIEHEKALAECQESLTEREKALAEREKGNGRRKPGPKPKAEG